MELQFPSVSSDRPHYESVYVALVHPSEPRSLWIRTTMKQGRDRTAAGAVWLTWTGPDGVRATKVDGLPIAPGGRGVVCGPVTQGEGGSRGEVGEGLVARWDLTFPARSAALRHLGSERLYRAPLPRTKATSPVPDLEVQGELVVDGQAVDLTGWTGMVGHNWGTEHAARWVWLRACGLGEDERGWLDAIVGRVRLGPVLSPWIAFGALELDGRRHQLGGMLRRGACVEVAGTHADVELPGPDVSVGVHVGVDLDRTVGWEYADPAGARHEVVNCSVAETVVTVREAEGDRTLRPRRRGVLEVGGDERAFDVRLQPYAD